MRDDATVNKTKKKKQQGIQDKREKLCGSLPLLESYLIIYLLRRINESLLLTYGYDRKKKKNMMLP